MIIENAAPQDLNNILKLYRIASDYQRSKFIDNVWPNFDAEMVQKEIAEQRQFKIIINDEIACIWAVTFSDSEIWGAKDKDAAIYIHRIATNPDYRGKNYVGDIVTWAKAFAKSYKKKYIRLDTCGNNTRLIAHYVKNGFNFLGRSKLEKIDTLPSHYHNAEVCYFEINLS